MADFAQILQRKIAENGWSQADAARAFGVSQATIHHWLSRRSGPTGKALARISTRLGIAIEDLLGASDRGMVREESRGVYRVGLFDKLRAGKGGATIESLTNEGEDDARMLGWMRDLRVKYRRSAEDAEAVRVAVRALFPPRKHPEILEWLEDKS
jgi:transcriptional regulator with XRE-family HTH domain